MSVVAMSATTLVAALLGLGTGVGLLLAIYGWGSDASYLLMRALHKMIVTKAFDPTVSEPQYPLRLIHRHLLSIPVGVAK